MADLHSGATRAEGGAREQENPLRKNTFVHGRPNARSASARYSGTPVRARFFIKQPDTRQTRTRLLREPRGTPVTLFTVGSKFTIRGQSFELVAIEPYQRADGRATVVLVWNSMCWECGAPFEATSSRSMLKAGYLTRRCKAHRRVGRIPSALRGRSGC